MRHRPRALLPALVIVAASCSGGGGAPAGGGDPTGDGVDDRTGRSRSAPTTAAPAQPEAPAALPGLDVGVLAGRAAHTATTLPDGSLLVAGGCVTDGCGTATADTFIVAADGDSVIPGPVMAEPRDSHTATLVDGGSVVLVGGFVGEGRPPLASIEVFEPRSRSMAVSSDLALGRGGHAAAALRDGRVLIAGGWIGPRTYTATTELVDPAVGAVGAGPDLPVAADALDALTLADGRVLVTGGQVEPGIATAAAAVFDPATETWTDVGPMLTPRFKHLSVLLPDGSALIIGGTTDDQTLLATTEIFDPATGRFGEGPELLEPRYKLQGGAVVVGNRVVIAGGGRTVEALDLSTGASRVVAEFADRGSFATINRLGSGDLLVAGGYDDRIDLRREIQLIDPDEL